MTQQKRWNPEYYFKHSATQLNHAKGLLDKYTFRGDENVLDIGCGDGKITAALSEFIPNGSITGIDKSPEMIRFAQNTFPNDAFTNVHFRQQDVLNLDETDQYDLIVSFSCLYYIKQQDTVLKNIKRALKPNGKILLMLYRKCPVQWAAIDKVVNSNQWRDYFNGFDPGYYEYLPDTYQTLLNENELNQFQSVFTPTEHITFDSKEKLNQFMRGWLPHIQKLPDEQHDAFMKDIVDAYASGLGLGDNPAKVDVPFVRLLVY